MVHRILLTQHKKRATLALCILTYVMVYLCRLNFSAAVLKIAADLSVSTTTMGVIGSLFFVSYAVGQLINGFIGDRVSPVSFIITATVGTGAINLMMTWADNLLFIRMLWIMNGYFQSIFWAACNRILSYYYGDTEHHVVSTGMSLSLVASYILSWAFLGKLLVDESWQCYFLVPAAIAGCVLCLWFLFMRFNQTVCACTPTVTTLNRESLLITVKREFLWLICIVSIFMGLVKEGIGLWAPVILFSIFSGDIDRSLLMIVLIPVGNFCGIILAGKLLKWVGEVSYALLVLMGGMSFFACGIILLKDVSPYGAIFFVAAVSGMAIGSNSILMSYLPLSYAAQNIVSTLIGIFDSSAYVGAAVSAYLLGSLLDSGDWQVIPVIWAVAGILGAILIAVRLACLKKRDDKISSD